MAADRAKTLARIHRVRTVQLNLARADEARAQDRFTSEEALGARIRQLADAVSPTPTASEGFTLVAAAHFRDRLQQSAEAAEARRIAAQAQADRAADARRAAHRDQSAVEKLMARAEADAALKALRALEVAPAVRKVRHDPC